MSIAAEKLVTVALNARSAGRLAQLRPFVRGLFQEDSDRARTGREALLAFSVRVLSAAILYLSQIVLARWMGSVQYGIYVFVWTWVLVLGGLSNLGLSTAMIRLVPAYRATNQLDLLRGLLRYGRLMAFAAATATALLGLAGLSLFGSMMSGAYMIPLYLGLVCVPMITLTDLHDGIGRGNGWIAVALVPPYVLRPLMVLWAMLAAHAFGWTMSAATATGAAIVATWATAALQSILVSRRLAAQLPPGPATRPADFWLRTSLPLLVISGSELLLQTTDVLVISSYLAPEHVAVYFASAKTMALVMFIHYAVGSAMAKRFAALSAKGDHEALRKVARDAVNWTFWPSLAAAVGLLALGKPLLWLFGPQFVDGYPIMFILVLGFLGRAAMGPSEFLLNMLGQQKACAAVISSMAVLNIMLQLLSVPRFGLVGAAAATAISLVLGAMLNTVVARRRLGLRIAIWDNCSPKKYSA